jgi:UDP-glucose 4-epimerase
VVELDKSSRILVTGGSGFIGSHLTTRLSRDGFLIDTLSKDEGDIRDKKLDLTGYDIIYHLAAVSNTKVCEDNPGLAWDVNVNGTLNILEKLGENQKLIFASSAHVYNPGSRPKREDDLLNPQDFYGLTKKTGENLIMYYSRKKGFSYAILRFFNIYGPGQSRGFLIPDAIEKYRYGKEVLIYNPEAMRDFLHVKEAVRVLVKAGDIEGVFNIAYGEGAKIGDVYKAIKKEMQIENVKEKVIDRKRDALIGDISRVNAVTGWKPEITLGEGIKEVVRYYS